MTKRPKYLHGNAGHTRTEASYTAVLLEACTLGNWREIVAATVAATMEADKARATEWLAGVDAVVVQTLPALPMR